MATKGDQIRNLVKAFGGTPRQSTIEDAIEDLLNNLPFGTKTEMVEIVPETTLTVGGTSPFPTLATGVEYFIEGKEYIVSVNGIQYRCVGGRRQDDRRRDLAILGTRTPDVPFEIYVFMTEGHSTFGSLDHQAQFWPLEDGDYTVAIYEEQEVVKQIDPKFVGGGSAVTIFYADYIEAGENAFLKHEDGSAVTVEEARKAGANVIIYDNSYGYTYKPVAFYEYNNAMLYTILSINQFSVKDINSTLRYINHSCIAIAGDNPFAE